jgi:hypothetical protein
MVKIGTSNPIVPTVERLLTLPGLKHVVLQRTTHPFVLWTFRQLELLRLIFISVVVRAHCRTTLTTRLQWLGQVQSPSLACDLIRMIRTISLALG